MVPTEILTLSVHRSPVPPASQGITRHTVPTALPVEFEESYSGELVASTRPPLPVLRRNMSPNKGSSISGVPTHSHRARYRVGDQWYPPSWYHLLNLMIPFTGPIVVFGILQRM